MDRLRTAAGGESVYTFLHVVGRQKLPLFWVIYEPAMTATGWTHMHAHKLEMAIHPHFIARLNVIKFQAHSQDLRVEARLFDSSLVSLQIYQTNGVGKFTSILWQLMAKLMAISARGRFSLRANDAAC